MLTSQNTLMIAEIPSTPIGPIWLAASEQGLLVLDFHEDRASFIQYLQHRFAGRPVQSLEAVPFTEDNSRQAETLRQAAAQVREYLNGQRREFDLPIDWSEMSPFQQSALRATFSIPCGQVSTYGDIARKIGRPRSARAVGRAEATNPMPLVIPCHRVLGTDGTLHGYGGRGGLRTKAWLLEMESAHK